MSAERAAAGGEVRLYMSVSVDGFVTGPDDGPEGQDVLHLRYRVRTEA